MHTPTVTAIQERAIQLLLAGSTVAAAARELGIDRTTIYTWRKHHPYFSMALRQARKIQTECLADGLQDLAASALDAIREILTSSDVPAAVRLRAAQTVLSNTCTTTALQQPPQSAQEPSEINHAGIEALIGPPIPHNSTEFDTFSVVEEVSEFQEQQPHQPFRREFPKTGRNEPCPCGSGLKYKRCCASAIQPQLRAAA